jgi:chromosome segregation ATPase
LSRRPRDWFQVEQQVAVLRQERDVAHEQLSAAQQQWEAERRALGNQAEQLHEARVGLLRERDAAREQLACLEQDRRELLAHCEETDRHYHAVSARLTQELEQAREEAARRNAELAEQVGKLTARTIDQLQREVAGMREALRARGRDLRPEPGPKNHPAEFLEKYVPLLIRGQKETIEEADKMDLGAEAALRILDEWEAQYQAKCAAAAAQ